MLIYRWIIVPSSYGTLERAVALVESVTLAKVVAISEYDGFREIRIVYETSIGEKYFGVQPVDIPVPVKQVELDPEDVWDPDYDSEYGPCLICGIEKDLNYNSVCRSCVENETKGAE